MEEYCVCCGEQIPEGRQVCWQCEQAVLKIGNALQSNTVSMEEAESVYKFLYWEA